MVGFLMAGFLLPFIARSWPNKEKISEVLRLCRIFLVIPAILLAVAAPAISEPLNQLLYHGREAQTSEVIDILFWCLPAFAIIQVHGTLMTASGNINTFVKLSGVFAVLNILLNFLVIPRYGAPGAAWVAVLTQNGFAVLLYMLSVRRTGISISGKEAAFYIVMGISVFLVAKYLFL
jgi:O-antigen/teichoic acid export membrane protein